MIISMSVVALVTILVFLAIVAWFVNAKGGQLNQTIRFIINAVLIITAFVIALTALGIWDEIRGVQVPRL